MNHNFYYSQKRFFIIDFLRGLSIILMIIYHIIYISRIFGIHQININAFFLFTTDL